MSAISKVKLFIFGASGNLGGKVISVLNSAAYKDKFEVSAAIRKDTLDSKDEKKAAAVEHLKASGVKLVSGDADKVDAAEIAKWIAGQDIVLSTISSYAPPPVDVKLLEAVKLAKVPWFIPSLFGVDLTECVTDPLPFLAAKKAVVDAIRAAGVNSFFIMTGAFLDYFLSPFIGVDIANAEISAPYSFDAKVTGTTTDDIARLTVEALLQREQPHVKNQVLHFAGDTFSFAQLHELLEAHFKKTFRKTIISREEALAAVAADHSFQNLPARYRFVFGEQKGIFWPTVQSWNAQHAKQVKVTTLKDIIANLK